MTIEGRDGDLFVPPDDTGDAMDGDTVQVIIDENGRGGPRGGESFKGIKTCQRDADRYLLKK